MGDPECATCHVLWDAARAAMARYFQQSGKLDIARRSGDVDAVTQLEPLLESAIGERDAAMQRYRSHQGEHQM